MTNPSVVVFDYGFGNVRSAVRAMERAGAQVELTGDVATAMAANGLVVAIHLVAEDDDVMLITDKPVEGIESIDSTKGTELCWGDKK